MSSGRGSNNGNKNNGKNRGRGRWNKPQKKNPKRGGPGVLLTCETGRESKCRQEGQDILQHYLDAENDAVEDTALSLDEEIRALKEKDQKPKVFSVFDSGCRGTVALLCTLPEAVAVEPYRKTLDAETVEQQKQGYQQEQDGQKKTTTTATVARKVGEKHQLEGKEVVQPKKQKTNAEGETAQQRPTVSTPPLNRWDPVSTVQKVFDDAEKDNTTAPSSRFIARMIPLQATCFANKEEIQHITKQLLEPYCTIKQASFAVALKRRNCGHLTSQEVITLVAEEAPKEWKVDLDEPQYTVIVEICKTLCGISVVENCSNRFGNFNLVELREKSNNGRDEE